MYGREMWVINSDGSDAVNVVPSINESDLLTAPVWSPDGQRIAYIRKHSITYGNSTNSVELKDFSVRDQKVGG